MYADLEQQNIKLFTHDIGFVDAATIEINGAFGIFLDLSCFETLKTYREALAHELGHCATGCTHKVCSPLDLIEKHEYKANRWAIEKYIPFNELCKVVKQGYIERWQLAEYFDFPENFIERALNYYLEVKQYKIA